jgi:hypothetical protein
VVTGPYDFLRIALDPIRLAVLGRAVPGPIDPDHVATELGVPDRKVIRAIGTLRSAGLLTDDLRLVPGVLAEMARSLPAGEPAAPGVLAGGWTEAEAEVLRTFFAGTRLTSIPVPRAKRRVVLERIVQEFEPGVRYPERRVNRIIETFHEDYASLRRYMVDEGLLTRADGVYWRTGGRYLPEPAGSDPGGGTEQIA